jgi:BirA family biotin operon repressor/biotin-[acetyl-CoA-carboxylase] ligase
MDEARLLAGTGVPRGTVICADYQEAGRGRIRDRPWKTERGKNLSFTLFLSYPGAAEIPRALTLKTGLALAEAVEDFAPALGGLVEIKWPNDIMVIRKGPDGEVSGAGKIAGILTESDGKRVFIGIGVNVAQRKFPPELTGKALSIALALGETGGGEGGSSEPARYRLLEKILLRLHHILEREKDPDSWRERLEKRLYLRGKELDFIPGGAGSEREVRGLLAGIGAGGELLLIPRGKSAPQPFVTGELRAYGWN